MTVHCLPAVPASEAIEMLELGCALSQAIASSALCLPLLSWLACNGLQLWTRTLVQASLDRQHGQCAKPCMAVWLTVLVLQALGPEALIPLTLLTPKGGCAMLCGDPRYTCYACTAFTSSACCPVLATQKLLLLLQTAGSLSQSMPSCCNCSCG